TEPDSLAGVPAVGSPVAGMREIDVVILGDDGRVLVRGTISTLGGALVRWELAEYRDLGPGCADAEAVDLVSSPCFGAVNAAGEWVRFSCDLPGDEVVVRSDSVEIRLRDDSGAERTYVFHAGSYEFRLRGTHGEWTALPAGVLPVTEAGVDESRYFSAVWRAEKNKRQDGRKIEEQESVGRVLWIGSRSKYFCVLIGSSDLERADGFVQPGGETGSPGAFLRSADVRVFAGPVEYDRLRAFGQKADELVDFGWPIIRWIGMAIFWFSAKVLGFIGNWGLRIVVVSVVLKVVMLPLTQKSFKSIRRMQLLQPRLAELQKKHKSDPVKQREALAKLYREEKVNPMGGCLPLLLQMPVFFALYRVLASGVELRGAPFVLWISDLSLPEVLISFGGNVLGLSGIGLLPVLMGLAMFFQQKMSATDAKQKSMMYLMPIFMTWLFMRFPAGLTLYWFVNNVLTIIQQELIKLSEARSAEGAEPGPASSSSG
ncbi:membrane protein insertase YidC, partial [Candidatus Fermentibacterales bacterium]|nr:membrane protein insertase YidC [Candidatus Fermentibacterales bacterium]